MAIGDVMALGARGDGGYAIAPPFIRENAKALHAREGKRNETSSRVRCSLQSFTLVESGHVDQSRELG